MKSALSHQEIKELVDAYVEATILNGKALERGASKDANRQADIATGAYQRLKADGVDSVLALQSLLYHTEPNVRSAAAVDLLEILPNEAVQTLREVASGSGLSAFIAEAALEEWQHKQKEGE